MMMVYHHAYMMHIPVRIHGIILTMRSQYESISMEYIPDIHSRHANVQ